MKNRTSISQLTWLWLRQIKPIFDFLFNYRTVLSVFFLVVLAMYVITIAAGFQPIPFKITDPKQAGFNIKDFRFEDYPDDESLKLALVAMFPVGTEKNFVNSILVSGGGAKEFKLAEMYKSHGEPSDHNIYRYKYNNSYRKWQDVKFLMPTGEFEIKIHIEFDENEKVVRIIVI